MRFTKAFIIWSAQALIVSQLVCPAFADEPISFNRYTGISFNVFQPQFPDVAKKEKVLLENEELQTKEEVSKERKLTADEAPLRKSKFKYRTPGVPDTEMGADGDPTLYIEPDAPPSVACGMDALSRNDRETATHCARQYVQYMVDMMFYVREWTEVVGQALIEEEKIEEDDFYSVPEMIDYVMAQSRADGDGSIIKPTHKDAMRRITPDPEGEVEVFYFYSLDCTFCRKMAPDVERLYQLAKKDPKVKMTGLTLGPTPASWLESYRHYTGLTLPTLGGEDVAKQLNIAFVPTLVVVNKNTNHAYIKGGQQSFMHMYEFVRTAQGKDATVTRQIEKLVQTPIGKVEERAKGGAQTMAINTPLQPKREKIKVERF